MDKKEILKLKIKQMEEILKEEKNKLENLKQEQEQPKTTLGSDKLITK